MTKKAQLDNLAKKILVCKKCRLWKSRKIAVPGEGSYEAKVIFLGESPGNAEDATGRPFVGPSGKFLDKLFADNNFDRKDFFISSVIKCHPPKNRAPRADELSTCRFWWQTQVKIIKPKIAVLLGGVALKAVLERKDLGVCHGEKIIKNNIIYFPTFHPAAGRRFPGVKKKMIDDFGRLHQLINNY